MAPLESHDWRRTIDLEHLPCKVRHHTLESFMAAGEVGCVGAVEVIRRNDCIVGAYFQHVTRVLWRVAIDAEGIYTCQWLQLVGDSTYTCRDSQCANLSSLF